jgi:hypothetical protein
VWRSQQSTDGGDEAQGSDVGQEAGEPTDGELGADGAVMRHMSSYTTPRAASAVDRRGARTSEVGRAAGWRAGAGPRDGDRRGWLAAEQRVSEREVGLGCEGASESCRGWATGGGSSARRRIWWQTETKSDRA